MDDRGYHYILDVIVSNNNILKNTLLLKKLFESILINFTILGHAEHKFATGGEGITGYGRVIDVPKRAGVRL